MRGALNFLTQESVLKAIATVRSGQVISCADTTRVSDGTARPVLIEATTEAGDDWLAINETITFPQHGPSSMTHLDALGHFLYEGRGYAKMSAADVTPAGITAQDVCSAATGIVGRGVLLDLAAMRGLNYLGGFQ